MDQIVELIQPKSVVPTAIEFLDIAGLVKGASKGEGLGNQFLSNIRTVDAICHVVRCFADDNVVHVNGKVDPKLGHRGDQHRAPFARHPVRRESTRQSEEELQGR